MNVEDADSMWLQKSIALPDPLPHVCAEGAVEEDSVVAGSENVAAPNTSMRAPATPESKMTPAGEMELTKMVLDTSAVIAAQRPSMARYSTRMSVPNSALINTQEFDDLRAKCSKMKRELMKVSDVQKDLDFARFELTRSQEELKLLRQSNASMKADLDDAMDRADKATRGKAELEARVTEEGRLVNREVEFLKHQVVELRQENSKRLTEISEQQENDTQTRIQSLRDELAAAAEQLTSSGETMQQLTLQYDQLEKRFVITTADLDAANQTIATLNKEVANLKEQYAQQSDHHKQFIAQTKKEQEETSRAQNAMMDERVEQLTHSKDISIQELKAELQEVKNKCRAMGNEVASLKYNNEQLAEELKQGEGEHAKELRRIAEEHRLALCEKQMKLEASVREAKGSTAAVEEETHSLRRQLKKLSEELSTVAAVLAQREKQIFVAEQDLHVAKDTIRHLEHDNAQLLSDAEANCAAATEANERLRRLNEDKDALEEEYTCDLRDAKDRIRSLEKTIMETRDELTIIRKESIKSGEDSRATTRQLRAELEHVTAERNKLQSTLQVLKHSDEAVDDLQARYAAELQKNEHLTVELRAAVNRCTSLEKQVDDNLRETITAALANKSPKCAPSRLRSASAVNTTPNLTKSTSLKRARTEDARVFAISGFDGNDILTAIKQLPNVAIAECKSNTPVPSNLTHLITNGQLTIKLLTALVRGCWVLPEAYVLQSLKQRTWLNERDFGFQHIVPPLLKKRIFITDAFKTSKHFGNAVMLINEGGALLDEDPECKSDTVICVEAENTAYPNGMTWEKMVELIYPVRIE